ncbi:MAG TPA: ABC transporter substrate-binding protein [Stellaceae bacterium]|nr:ABC transporter substrate-binding protein [Stellaceae bacterium]
MVVAGAARADNTVTIGARALAAAGVAHADSTVTIGALYPLAQRPDARWAIETAVAIVNAPHPGLAGLPLGAGQGLPNLAGAKLSVSLADDLDNPSVAQAQALRFVTHDHVAALIGAGTAAETLAASAVAAHHATPFLVPDEMAPGIIGRGDGWVYRTSPLAADIARAYTRFLVQQKSAGGKIDTVAVLAPASEPGKEFAAVLCDAAKQAGLACSGIRYPPGANDLSGLVQDLKAGNPDVVIAHADPAIARLLVTTMNTLGYRPPVMIGDDAGFSRPSFITGAGNLAQGLIGRGVWNPGDPGTATRLVNDLYKSKSGHDLDDPSAEVMEGVFVLADAIDRAGSTDATAVRDALRRADLQPDRLIVGYDGVKFDATGRNTLAATYLTQLQGKQYVTVWPPERAAGKLALPF